MTVSTKTYSNDANIMPIEFVYGGTFDPIHNGHLSILKSLQKLAPDTQIRLIPCSVPALKASPASSFEHRVAMLKLAIHELSDPLENNIIIDERENNRKGPSFMFETLTSLKADFTDRTLILVMGADTAIDLQQWYHWQELNLLCHLLILNRPKIDSVLIESKIQQAQFKIEKDFQSLTFRPYGLAFLLKMAEKHESSTQIRQNRQNNLELDSMIPQSVIKYINNHQLYVKDDH